MSSNVSDLSDALARLRELLEKATPGPWVATGYCGCSVIGTGEKPRAGIIIQMDDDNPQERANSELVAAAVNFVRDNIDRLSPPASPQGVEGLGQFIEDMMDQRGGICVRSSVCNAVAADILSALPLSGDPI